MKIGIFGYFSLLLSASTHGDLKTTGFTPAILNDWARNFRASRKMLDNDRKRFVSATTFDFVPRFAYASIERKKDTFCNGLVWLTDDTELENLDFREQGCTRIEVTSQLSAYPGFTLPDVRIFAYVDAAGVGPAPVNFEYCNMAIIGAKQLDVLVPGFSADFQVSTPWPDEPLENWKFIYWARDGKTLWMIDERTDCKTCLLKLPDPGLFEPLADTQSLPEWSSAFSPEFSAYDLRTTGSRPLPRVPHAFLEALWSASGGRSPALYTGHRQNHPLLELASLAKNCTPEALEKAKQSKDGWVRTFAERSSAVSVCNATARPILPSGIPHEGCTA